MLFTSNKLMIIIIPILIVTTTEQLISKRGGKMASHACPPHLRKLLSAHFVFYILHMHILGDCCTDSVSPLFFRGLKSIGISLPLPLSGKCKMLCELQQLSVVHLRLPAQCSVKRMSLSPKVERKVEPATWYRPCHNSSHRGPENADRGVKG